MTTKEILDYVHRHPSGRVKVALADIDGVLRGKYVSAEKFASIAEGSLGFCDVTFGWDMADVAYDNGKFTGWHTGYPDTQVRIDLSTFRKIPWENDLPMFLGELTDAYPCPRCLLQRIRERASSMGFLVNCSQEFEWFNFSETPATLVEKGFRGLTPLTPGMFGYSLLRSSLKNAYMSDLFSLLGKFGIPLEGIHTETGPGVYEAAITYAPLLEAADRAILFKAAVKEIANAHGIIATFMAKWNENLPGCSGHIHQSLWDGEGTTNLFYLDGGVSDLMRSYIAGQLFCLPQILPMIAPTVNSYKRLVEGAWAPTTLTWGIDNRTVALRALPGGKKATRLETRVVGSDTNPYLAAAACVAAGLYGISHGLVLEQPATVGNGYRDTSHGVLPGSLAEATAIMRASPVASELFGADFVDHFARTREWEWKQYSKAVSDWELKRYFEII